jgi:hypothetical protein
MELRTLDFEYRNVQTLRSEYLTVDVVTQEACQDGSTLRAERARLNKKMRNSFGFSKSDCLIFLVDNNRGGHAEMTAELLLKLHPGE